MYSKLFESCQQALDSEDLFTIQHCVDKMARWMVETRAPDDVRLAFSKLLESKADETGNRVIAVYLRSVARNCTSPMLDLSR